MITELSVLEPTLWRFFFGSPEHIDVECLWRVIRSGRVVRTREDHGQHFGLPSPVDAANEAFALLSHSTVVAVELKEATAGLYIESAGDLRLGIIPVLMATRAGALLSRGNLLRCTMGRPNLYVNPMTPNKRISRQDERVLNHADC